MIPDPEPFDQGTAFLLGLKHHQLGQLPQAENVYRQILRQAPAYAPAHCNLGVLLAQQGRLDEAVASYEAAIAANPAYGEAYFNLGNAFRKKGQPDQAIASYETALRWLPGNGSIHYNLGLALAALGRVDESINSFQETLRYLPDLAETYNHLGGALQTRGRLAEAVAAFNQFLGLRPTDPRGYNNLGLALEAMGRVDDAFGAYAKALELKPDYAEAHNNLGVWYENRGRGEEALGCFQKALRYLPDYPLALNNMGNACRELGRLDEAVDWFGKMVSLPYRPALHSNYLLTLNYHPRFDPLTIRAEHRRWAEIHADSLGDANPSFNRDATPGRRLRVGYVSADFRAHAVAFFLEPLLAAHDRRRFHLIGYANVGKPDAVTERLRSLTDDWRFISGLDDALVADLIRRDAVDILVDLGGHTAGNRLLVFARKPAPVQVTYFGYPNTSGLKTMDYRISDPWADPPGMTERFYTEEIIRLPEIAWCYQPSPSPPVGNLPALEAGPITFASLNNLAKITTEALILWARLLREVADSRLYLLTNGGPATAERVHGLMEEQKVSRERVLLLERRPREQYLDLYRSIDICLDPFPYNGGITTCDALWMGVPVISLAGEAYVSRQGVSLLSNLGLGDWIADSPDSYVDIGVRKSKQLPELQQLRQGLRERMRVSAILDAPRLLGHLEAVYQRMWDKRRARR